MRIMFKQFKGVRLRDRVRGDGIRRDLGVEKITLKARHAVCAVRLVLVTHSVGG